MCFFRVECVFEYMRDSLGRVPLRVSGEPVRVVIYAACMRICVRASVLRVLVV